VYEGRCPHQGALLGEGELEGNALVCRNHRWQFDVDTGARVGGGSGGKECLRACPVRLDGADVLIDIAPLMRPAARAMPSSLRTLEDLPGPRGLPIVGNALHLDLERMHLILEGWAKTYGPMYLARIGSQKVLVISDPTLAEPMLRSRPDTFRRPVQVEKVFEEMMVPGVFSAEGEAWRTQRRLAMEALSQRHLRGFYPTLEQVARRLLRRWGEAADTGRVLDVADELKRFTVDVTTQLVFGHDLNTLEKGDEDILQRHLEHIFPAFNRRINAVFPYWRYIRLPADRRLSRALREVHVWLTSVIEQARVRLVDNPARAESPTNFIEAMLTARDAEGRPFSDGVIFGNALQMLLAGEDTTAYTLAWAMHHLSDNPEATASLRREADAVLGDALVPADLEQIKRLSYATAVANEAMRLRPVAPVFFFEPIEDVVVGGVAVPKGTTILSLLRMATLDPSRFHAPRAFTPERWIEGAASSKAHDASVHIPFGSGPRICPGRSLALVEMRLVLGSVYKNFEVERVGSTRDVRELLAFTMMPVGLRMRVRRRKAS
jgi:cytochrome P450